MISDDTEGESTMLTLLSAFIVSYALTPIDQAFTHHPLFFNIFTAAILMATGDYIAQYIEAWTDERPASANRENHGRSLRVGITGGFVGMFSHWWYQTLELLVDGPQPSMAVNGQTIYSVLKKIIWDQIIAGTFFLSFFILGMGILERKSAAAIWREWSCKFLTLYKNDWKVWPLAQLINFTFVPLRFRVLYVNSITLCWDVYLSYAKHQIREQSRRNSSISITPQDANPIGVPH